MIHLHTGLPGAGKTLCTLVEVKERAEKENRPVFYSGIADLKLPWVELERGEDWHLQEPGSIVVIDEAQRIFRPRGTGAAVPEHVAKLETHRHSGIDLYIITQHPKLVDANVRRLVGQHVHFVRAFGTNAVTRHQWGEVKDDPQVRDDSISSLVPYPKEAFAWYKSAEVHTHKARVPWRVWSLVVIPVVLAGCVWIAVQSFGRWFDSERIAKGAGVESPAGTAQREAVRRPPGRPASSDDAGDWLLQRRPRVPGLVHTAPIYDEITQPVRAPFPAVCIATVARCVCYTQQGTRMGVQDELCRRFAADGFFREWDEIRERDQRGEPQRPAGSGADVPPQIDRGVSLADSSIVPGGVEPTQLGTVADRPSVRARRVHARQPSMSAP